MSSNSKKKGVIDPGGRKGFALVTAILAIMILMALGFLAISVTTGDLKITSRVVGEKKALSAAETGIHRLMQNFDPENMAAAQVTNEQVNAMADPDIALYDQFRRPSRFGAGCASPEGLLDRRRPAMGTAALCGQRDGCQYELQQLGNDRRGDGIRSHRNHHDVEIEEGIMSAKIRIMVALLVGLCLWGGTSRADETALFTTSTAPDALIVLDLSGSMAWNPPGDDLPYGSTESCYADTANCSGTGCTGGFCSSSKSGLTYYARASCGTPDTLNCVGANCSNGFCTSSKGATTVYAASSCSTPDTTNCRGTGCGRTDGFCNSPISSSTYYAHSSCSTPDTSECRYSETWSDCRDGFCASPHSSSRRSCTFACTTAPCNTQCTTASCSVSCTSGGCTNNCSRLAIAKRSVFNILDDNNDNTINSTDETSLGVRLGYMRFKNCNDDERGGNSYTAGCNMLIKTIGSSYSSINTAVSAESASGGTPSCQPSMKRSCTLTSTRRRTTPRTAARSSSS